MTFRCANGDLEGLERDSAEVEWETLEGGVCSLFFGDPGASAGAVGIFRGPFAVGNLEG